MIQLSIEEPKIEKFFNSSKDEIMKALKFIVEIKNNCNNLYYYPERKRVVHELQQIGI